MNKKKKPVLLDGSLLITEALVRAGADTFIGYPITPANLLYAYGARRFPTALPAPDEITTVQWMAGFAAAGKIPVTATSFPGLALMVESINMAYMMELPMVIVVSQRLGPSTGTATVGAQGDLLMMNGMISGGYPLATICISDALDCWQLAADAVHWSVSLRTPVILLTSKDDVMTVRDFDLSTLPDITPVSRSANPVSLPFRSYEPDANLVPAFIPVGDLDHQIRITASTHNKDGKLENKSREALDNTIRLQTKLTRNLKFHTRYELDEDPGGSKDLLIVSYGISAQSCRQAVAQIRSENGKVSLLVAKTLLPVPDDYLRIMDLYKRVVIVEENHNGQFKQIIFGSGRSGWVRQVNAIAHMITPEEIIQEVNDND